MTATHDPNIQINIILDAPPQAMFGFTPMHVSEETIAERVRSYSSAKDVAQDNDITSTAKAALTAMFSQAKRPGLVKLGKKLAIESWLEALTAIELADDNWYGLTVDTRTDSDIVIISGFAESRLKFYVAQNADADWLVSGAVKPAGLTSIGTNERTAIIYHDDGGEYADCAWLANRIVFNPDTYSAPWDAAVQGVAPYTTGLTTGQRTGALDKSCNVMLPYGPVETFVDAGVNLAGRPIYEIITSDWFKIRLESKIAQAKINASARGEKIPLGNVGVSIMRPLVESQFSEGVTAGHFVADQWEVTFYEPTAGDIAAQRMRATGRAQLAVSARIFEFDFVFQRNAVFTEGA